MSKGLSYNTFGASIDVGKSTCYDWEDQHPEWKECKEIAIGKAQLFMEKRLSAKISGVAIDGLNVKDIDNSCLIFALKTRFHKDYSEKNKVEVDGQIAINIDEDDAAV